MTTKGDFISDLTGGKPVEGVFVATDVERRTTKSNAPYWDLQLKDKTGSIPAKVWSRRGVLHPESLASNILVHVTGKIEEYRQALQVKIEDIRPLSPEEKGNLDENDFLAETARNAGCLLDELLAEARREFTYAPWSNLVELWFGDEQRASAFQKAPAAKAKHHTGPSGLAEHTLEVFRICQAMANIFPNLDRQTLLAGALFHDIGKVREMTCENFETVYTPDGSLLGHMILGVSMLEPLCHKAGLPDSLTRHLLHLILSHHGRHEYGAPKLPATPEAVVLHFADNLDSRLNILAAALSGIPEDSLTPTFNRDFETVLMQPMRTPCTEGVQEREDSSWQGGTVEQGRSADAFRAPSQDNFDVPEEPSWMNEDDAPPADVWDDGAPLEEDAVSFEEDACPPDPAPSPDEPPAKESRPARRKGSSRNGGRPSLPKAEDDAAQLALQPGKAQAKTGSRPSRRAVPRSLI